MHTCKIAASLISLALGWLGMVDFALAQRITYEADGRARTYEFNQPPNKPQARRAASTSRSVELPRGPKNLPWEEPGKLSGNSGVRESGTTLELRRLRRASGHSRKERIQPEAQRSRSETQKTSTVSPAKDRPLASGAEAEMHNPITTSPQSSRSNERTPEMLEAQAETRAKIISEAMARASAEEQRRSDLEKRRDPRLRRSELLERDDSELKRQSTQVDPATTGAIGSKASSKPVEGTAPGKWKSGACRLLFFGVLPGC
jgi:hypothetical protein